MANIRVPPVNEKATQSSVSAGLADRGRKAAARKAATTVEKIARAQRAIEIDLEKYGGVYPYAGGRLSADEVLRRAGLNETLLQKPRHHDLREKVNKWVKDVKKKLVNGRQVVRKAVTERVDRAQDEVAQIRQAWAVAELEFIEQANEIARLKRKCAELENEIRLLQSVRGNGQEFLGSGLIDQSQKMTAAAVQMAEKKV